MPELPEVETIARTLAPQIVGRAVVALAPLHPKVLQAGADLLPRLERFVDNPLVITRVFRRAKVLLIALSPAASPAEPTPEEELLLAFHLKMTGSFFVHPAGSPPLKHTRLILDLSDGNRLFFDDMRTFGYCRIMRPGQLPAWDFWAALGPEPLDMGAADLAAHFAVAFAGRRVNVKAAMLNQEVVAGVGNIYADESLFQAGIRPTIVASALGAKRLLALAEALQQILHRSIRECGSSIRNYRDAHGNAGAFQNTFAVYGRKGERCVRCDSPLVSARVAGRGTVYCPACQK